MPASGLELILNNCCYVSSLTKNIILVDALIEQGYNVIINIEIVLFGLIKYFTILVE